MRELESHLEPLKLSGMVNSRHDGCIAPGEEWEPQIKTKLNKARIIILLISVDFIRSGYCYNVELQQVIERHKAGDACVIPVILRSCLWKQVPVSDMRLGDLQALPKDAKAIAQWTDRDDAFTSVAEGIFSKIQQLQLESEKVDETQVHGTKVEQEQLEIDPVVEPESLIKDLEESLIEDREKIKSSSAQNVPAYVTVTDRTFEREVLESCLPVLVNFWAPWSGPCRMIAPVIDEIAEQYKGRIKVAKVNADENPVIASQYGIRSVPTLFIFKHGARVDMIVGALPTSIVAQTIEKFL